MSIDPGAAELQIARMLHDKQHEQALSALRAEVLRLDRDNDALMLERDALRDQVEALRKDAERYRFLRSEMDFENTDDPDTGKWYSTAGFKRGDIYAKPGSPSYASVDEIVDAAMEKTE